jgi:hypothetical protein
VLCPPTRVIHSSHPCSIDLQPVSQVHPTFVTAVHGAQLNLVPEGCFEQYATGGPCPPLNCFRRPGLWGQVRDTTPLNFRRNPAYSRKPFVHRPLSSMKYIVIFIRRFAHAFCKLLLARLNESVVESIVTRRISHSLDHVLLALSRSGLVV